MVRSPTKWLSVLLIVTTLGAISFVLFWEEKGKADQNTEYKTSTGHKKKKKDTLGLNKEDRKSKASSQKAQNERTVSPSSYESQENTAGFPPRVKSSKSRLIMRGPKLSEFKGELNKIEKTTRWYRDKKRTEKHPYVGIATDYRAKIYPNTRGKGSAISYARRGSRFPVKSLVNGTGCEGGEWYKKGGPGYICTAKGFSVHKKETTPKNDFIPPDLYKAEPYKYGEIRHDDALLYRRPPTSKERDLAEEALTKGEKLPSYVIRRMQGDFTIAMGREVTVDGTVYVRTSKNRYVLKEDLKVFPLREMHGEVLGPQKKLPIAFVYKPKASVYKIVNGDPIVVGQAQKHARFHANRVLKREDGFWVFDDDHHALKRKDVRICRTRTQPKHLRGVNRWIHVDLSEQTIVAYKGKKPVFATLISSGIPSRRTPLGLYRINYKQVSTTMSGPDDEVGWYDIAEVPWTMYYRNLYAIHGAYWHNDFGKKKSHGCTNMAPADAKWLFHWSRPNRPIGWHSVRDSGTYVWFTN